MHSLPILAATRFETFLSGFPHLAGMVVVMVSLTILWGVCAFTAYLIKTLAPAPALASAPALAPAAPLPAREQAPVMATPTDAIPPQIVAAIAAAVATTVGKDHKIVAIKSQDSNWGHAGRQAVLGSHKIR